MRTCARELTWSQKANGALQFLSARLAGYPTLVNLEVTRRCNARCDFCRYWTTRQEEALRDYVPVVRRLKPSVVVFTGGEPLLRRDLEDLIRGVRQEFPAIYLGLVTNGALLTVKRAQSVWNAGLNQITVSLDYLDVRHELARGIPGLTRRILARLPELVSAGVDNLVVQAVVKSGNLDCIGPIIEWARANHVKVALSAYTAAKNGNDSHRVTCDQLPVLRQLIREALWSKQRDGTITSSSYYLERIPEYFDSGGIGGCPSGRRFVTVDPAGSVYRCSESTDSCWYADWRPGRFGPTDCRACWVPCRGESQAPLSWERLKQVASLYAPEARSRSRPSQVPKRTTAPKAREVPAWSVGSREQSVVPLRGNR